MPRGYHRPTAASENHGHGKSPNEIEMELRARGALVRASRMRASTARERASRDGRMNVLCTGTARANAERFTDARNGRDFGLTPCALPLHMRGIGPDPVERARQALQEHPDGWLMYAYYQPKHVVDYFADRLKAFEEKETALEAHLREEVVEAELRDAERVLGEERDTRRMIKSLTEGNARMRAEIEANYGSAGKLD